MLALGTLPARYAPAIEKLAAGSATRSGSSGSQRS